MAWPGQQNRDIFTLHENCHTILKTPSEIGEITTTQRRILRIKWSIIRKINFYRGLSACGIILPLNKKKWI